jgi:hypothetical protein
LKEQWKTVEDFEAYEVSDQGRVRRRLPGKGPTKIGHMFRPGCDKLGYYYVILHKESKSKAYTRKVHRLVAKAFLPNPLNLPEVNHKGKKKDNRAHKLEWRSKKGHAQDQIFRNQRGLGVFFRKDRNVWIAKLGNKQLGTFSTKEKANKARNKAVKALPYIL